MLLTYTLPSENIYGYYARGTLLNGYTGISGKVIEIFAIYLDAHRYCSAVHSVGSICILCPMSWVRIPSS